MIKLRLSFVYAPVIFKIFLTAFASILLTLKSSAEVDEELLKIFYCSSSLIKRILSVLQASFLVLRKVISNKMQPKPHMSILESY